MQKHHMIWISDTLPACHSVSLALAHAWKHWWTSSGKVFMTSPEHNPGVAQRPL